MSELRFFTGGSGRLEIVRRLLDMLYTPDELMQTLGISKYMYDRLIEAGAPVITSGFSTYIHGKSFVNWFDENRKRVAAGKLVRSEEMAPDFVFCFGCRKPVHFTITSTKARTVAGVCDQGHKVSKILSMRLK